MKEAFGEDDDTADPFLEHVATTAKQLAKLDEAERLLAPHDLAKAYLEAILDDKKKEELLQKAFGKLTDGAKRDRTESMLAKYLPSSSVASQAEEDNDNIMVDAADSSSESDEDVP